MEETPRTEFIVRLVMEVLRDPQRNVLVLTHRVAHVDELCAALVSEEVAALRTGMKPEERTTVMSARVIVATYQLCSEGMDIPSRNCIVLATPKKKVEQTVGRIQRTTPSMTSATTLPPLVIDVVDYFSVFAGMDNARLRHYTDMGYTIVKE